LCGKGFLGPVQIFLVFARLFFLVSPLKNEPEKYRWALDLNALKLTGLARFAKKVSLGWN